MKKYSTLALLLLLSAALFAQSKKEFGLLFKVGNYHLPKKTIQYSDIIDEQPMTNTQKADQSYTFGVWGSLPLGKHAWLVAELLYRNSFMANKDHWPFFYEDQGQLLSDHYNQTDVINEHALSIPLKLFWTFKEKSRFRYSIGSGLTRPVTVTMKSEIHYSSNSAFEHYNYSFPIAKANSDDFLWLAQWNAGAYYRLTPNTFIGLEYQFEQTSKQLYSTLRSDFLIDCLCYGYPNISLHNMHSFSVSLRHNLLE